MQVVTGEEMRKIDRFAMDELGMKEELLMENAGRAAARQLEKHYGSSAGKKVAVLIGKGNNGGDGFVIARILLEKGWHLDTWLLSEAEQFKGAARYHKELYEHCGYEWQYWSPKTMVHLQDEYSIMIDAMLGTGVTGELREPFKEAAALMNNSKGKVVSIDVPSGIPSGEEPVPDTAVKADMTITLQAPKVSAYLYPAKHHYGQLLVTDIGIPAKAMQVQQDGKREWREGDVVRTLPGRSAAAYKGSHGKGLLIGGSQKMPGAPAMASSACLYSGAGLLTAAVPFSAMTALAASQPEVMLTPLPEENGYVAPQVTAVNLPIEAYDSIAAGPGLGRGEGTRALVKHLVSKADVPLLLDADGLYFLPELEREVMERRSPLILTPHPGEMAHLAGVSISDVNRHRFTLSQNYARQHKCYVVLKGPDTIVTTPEGRQYVNTTGNEILARGGTGDILTGIMLGLVLQKGEISAAASNAVYLHGYAADLAVQEEFHSYSMASTDLIRYLPPAFRSIVSSL
ncbi:NAD(P)H-hydrate dehydratase [Salibacterium aidingense]|uniref:NAD(P)H-hydrate dehydratase n=1 Tax=Salibacterium aidingense TaxID=384933 RepID=UPI003BBD6882